MLIEPFDPKMVNGRSPMLLVIMRRIHLMQQWFACSDPALEEALRYLLLLRQFAGLDAFEDVMPDESTFLCLHNRLELHEFAIALFAEVDAVLSGKGLSIKDVSVVDTNLIAAPSSTKSQNKKCDPEISHTKKCNQWYSGMTSRRRSTPTVRSCEAGCGHKQSEAAQVAHIGVDIASGLIYGVKYITAKFADNFILKQCLHGEGNIVFAVRGYSQNNPTIGYLAREKPKGSDLAEKQTVLSVIHAIVEHPFRVIKQKSCVSPRFAISDSRSTWQIVTLFMLTKLWMARHRLMPTTGEIWP